MKESEAKIRFDAGGLKLARIVPAEMEDGWVLQVSTTAKEASSMERKRGGRRNYKTIDAACRTAKEIGFSVVEVVLRG